MVTQRLLALLLALAGAACGSNRPTIPPELLDSGGGDDPCGYPPGPYGTEPGQVAQNLSFAQGWMNPSAAGFDTSTLAPIEFCDFLDPTGQTFKVLLVNTSALWCSACKIEHETLGAHYESRKDKGFVVLSLLFEDNNKDPASAQNLATWTKVYDTTFPMAIDPEYSMGVFQPVKATAPYNMVLDARTMTILSEHAGDPGQPMWDLIDAKLAEGSGG